MLFRRSSAGRRGRSACVHRPVLLTTLVASLVFAAPRPRLGVLLIIDQLSLESFDARAPTVTGGIKRMLTEGVRFRQCEYEVAPTITSAGHATLITGAYAESHGIVSNEWVDHTSGLPVLSTEDPAYQVIGRPPQRDGTAPTWLRAATLGDSIKLADARAKVVTISGKDRASILTAGRSADAAIWFDVEKPFFTTSTFYAPEIPAWVVPTNEAIAKLMSAGTFVWGLPQGETDREQLAERPALQPILDGFEVDLALAAVKAFELGKDEAPDLLVVSFSGHDRIGHRFGPDSPEAQSEFAVIDRELGRLFERLDSTVGKGRYVVALTSDHGVAPLPEFSKARGLDAGRVNVKALVQALEAEADTALGKSDWFGPSKSPGLYATPSGRSKLHGLDDRLRALARKQPGVLDLLPLPSVMNGSLGGYAAQLYRRGTVDDRSADFIIVTRPYWTIAGSDATGHSTTYSYDRLVPLLFFGAGIAKGSGDEAHAVDVAPTLARLLGVATPASATGRVLDLSGR